MKKLRLNLNSDEKSMVKKSKGPPNRMNDLSYTEWMRFQKSFFRHKSFQDLIRECIYFFTKAVWDDGRPSVSLVVGFSDFSISIVPSRRMVVTINDQFPNCLNKLELFCEKGKQFDFIMINLFDNIELEPDKYLASKSDLDKLFNSLRILLRTEKYCGIVSNSSNSLGTTFPIPWSISHHGRNFLRLKDEKIGLMSDENRVYSTLFFQNIPDERGPVDFSPQSVFVTKDHPHIPSWIIPKPPPRKRRELLHPAKFPETLVEEFIRIFTNEGDSIFDPMVGTGSTVLAAARIGRNGYGIDLSQEFVSIAKERLRKEFPVTLFEKDMQSRPKYEIIRGDATKLDELNIFRDMKFHYCITSPPYWSMLRNRGSEYQRSRRRMALPLFYSDDERDLGNISDYDQFLRTLVEVYKTVASKLVGPGYLTIILKNIKRKHVVYPLAWDIVYELCKTEGVYDYIGNTFWCQDDVPMKPFAVGIYWVSNTVHHYCLHFQKRLKLA